MECKYYLEKLRCWYDSYQQTISCSKLATEAQEQGLKTVQDYKWRH